MRRGIGQDLVAQLAVQAPGQAEAARTADAIGQLIVDHVGINAVDWRRITLGRGTRLANVLQYLPQQHRLKLARNFADLFLVRKLGVARQLFQRQLRRIYLRMELGVVDFHFTA